MADLRRMVGERTLWPIQADLSRSASSPVGDGPFDITDFNITDSDITNLI